MELMNRRKSPSGVNKVARGMSFGAEKNEWNMRKKAFVGPKRQSKVWSEEVNSIEVCEISSDDGVFWFDTEPVSVSSSDGSTHRHTESLSLFRSLSLTTRWRPSSRTIFLRG